MLPIGPSIMSRAWLQGACISCEHCATPVQSLFCEKQHSNAVQRKHEVSPGCNNDIRHAGCRRGLDGHLA